MPGLGHKCAKFSGLPVSRFIDHVDTSAHSHFYVNSNISQVETLTRDKHGAVVRAKDLEDLNAAITAENDSLKHSLLATVTPSVSPAAPSGTGGQGIYLGHVGKCYHVFLSWKFGRIFRCFVILSCGTDANFSL